MSILKNIQRKMPGGFPLKVLILKKYDNMLKPEMDVGRYVRQKIDTPDGRVERTYIWLKKNNVEIRAPDIKSYNDIENKRYLYLFQLDRKTFYPIQFQNEKIMVEVEQPLQEKAEDGSISIKKDEAGNILTQKVLVPLFYGNLAYNTNEGKLVDVPSMMTYHNYDKDQWQSSEIESANRLYKSKSFWEKYGQIIIYALSIMAILIMVVVFMQNLTKGLDAVAKIAGEQLAAQKEATAAITDVAGQLKAFIGSQGSHAPLAAPN